MALSLEDLAFSFIALVRLVTNSGPGNSPANSIFEDATLKVGPPRFETCRLLGLGRGALF